MICVRWVERGPLLRWLLKMMAAGGKQQARAAEARASVNMRSAASWDMKVDIFIARDVNTYRYGSQT